MNFTDLFYQAVKRYPENIALVDGEKETTYRQLARMSERVAGFWLDKGFSKGDRVALLIENSIPYVASYLGILMAGCVAVPINTDNSRENIVHILNDCTVKGVIGDHKFIEKYDLLQGWNHQKIFLVIPKKTLDRRCFDWDELMHKPPSGYLAGGRKASNRDLACIVYTSGTTGKPKGVMLTHDNIVSNTLSIIEYLGLTEKDSILVVIPLFYSYGSSLLHTHLAVGGTLYLEKQFVYPNMALKKLSEKKITGFAGVPSTYALLLNRSNFPNLEWPYLRYVTQAGGPMAPSLIEKLAGVLPTAKIYIMYGQTEATARLSYLEPDKLLEKKGSVGKAIPGVELKVVEANGNPVKPGETGEIIARGPNVMLGYWDKPEETKKVLRNGWLYTGDLATIDDEGFIYIVGRKSEMIKSGAHRIGPKEIEEVLLELPEVSEVAVLGIPDDILGEKIVAVVVPSNGVVPKTQKVLNHCCKKLASFKVPHEIKVVDSLPKTSSGKIKKYLLKEHILNSKN